ncbi:PadR family transcriptional regulator [Thalassotalea atypica]|uniref:PadR family transcriptional regulator n=1 Tax=Thalassotalea atypica TaxID=2054316 RepID=UPI002572DBF4|nr:helix-turn-helix transcriptional regulator [Thalassotalea atypica]
MTLSKDFVAASTTPLILSVLSIEESYGYAIIAQVKELSDGEIQWADGMLYPILHRLEKKGWVEAFWGVAETGRKRKYYRLCDEGKTELTHQRAQWQKLNDMLKTLERKANV